MQKAATQIEQAASENNSAAPARRGVQRVVIERASFNIRDYLWSGTMGLMSAVGQLTVVVFLSFFSLASGNLFRRKLVRIAGTSLERKKVTMQVLPGDATYNSVISSRIQSNKAPDLFEIINAPEPVRPSSGLSVEPAAAPAPAATAAPAAPPPTQP